MKIRTKLIISFFIILLVPMVLSSLAIAGFSQVQKRAIEQNYGIEDAEVYKFSNSVQMLNRYTASDFDELTKLANAETDKFLNKEYLKEKNEQLKKKFSYIVVRMDNNWYYNGGSENEDVLELLCEMSGEDDEILTGPYLDGSGEVLVKESVFQLADGGYGSFFIVSSTKGTVPEIRKLIVECFIAICLILMLTAALLIAWIYRSMIVPIKHLQISAENIKAGNLDYELHYEGKDEIGELCESFEEMRLKLKETAEEKLRNERQNRELISNIAHDLKTPITAVKGYSEGIIDKVANTPEKVDKYIRTIYNKATEMDTLINELTLYSKIDSNRIPYNFAKINVAEYFNDCIEEVGLDLESKGLRLAYTNYVTEDTIIISDPEQLRRVIHNIIGNSVKYMNKKEGFINFRIKDVGDFIQVEIEDNGRGIAPADIPYIFERFYRADASRNSTTGGSGIGLSIVKKIVEDHGGKIWATSKEGTGTIMYFVIRKYQEVINE